jgi:hypothetical protein
MQGGKIPIETSSSETTDAVQTFLLFQLVDHKTRRFASHRRLAITLLSRVTGKVLWPIQLLRFRRYQELTEGNQRVHKSSSEPKILICNSEAVDSNCWF